MDSYQNLSNSNNFLVDVWAKIVRLAQFNFPLSFMTSLVDMCRPPKLGPNSCRCKQIILYYTALQLLGATLWYYIVVWEVHFILQSSWYTQHDPRENCRIFSFMCCSPKSFDNGKCNKTKFFVFFCTWDLSYCPFSIYIYIYIHYLMKISLLHSY